MKIVNNIVAILCIALIALNCGGEQKKTEYPEKPLKLKTETPAVTTDANLANLVISGNDGMQFDKKELRVKAGQNVKLTLRHTGRMNVNVMGHNVVILNKGVNLNAFGAKAAGAKATNYIPENSDSDIIAYTKLIGGGETTAIEFKAPEPGVYDFICSFPGHYALMKGKFIVE